MKVAIVITGSLRNKEHLEKVMDSAFKVMAASPTIGKICLSTTDEENSARQSLKPWLDRPDFSFIHSPPPSRVVKGHRLHQLLQLSNALRLLDSEDWVLKLRTDKLILSPDLLIKCIQRVESNEPLYRSKFGVIEGHIFLPWYINDMTFFAQKQSLEEIVSLDETADTLAPGLTTEQAIWSKLLRTKTIPFYNATRTYTQIYQFHPEARIPLLARALRKTSNKLYRALYKPKPRPNDKIRLDARFSEIEYILHDYWSILAERFFSMAPMTFEDRYELDVGGIKLRSNSMFSRYGLWGSSFSDVEIFRSLSGNASQ